MQRTLWFAKRLVSRAETLQFSMGGAACLGLQAKACVITEPEHGDEDNLDRGWRRSISAGPAACCCGAGFSVCQRGRVPAAVQGSAMVQVLHFLAIT